MTSRLSRLRRLRSVVALADHQTDDQQNAIRVAWINLACYLQVLLPGRAPVLASWAVASLIGFLAVLRHFPAARVDAEPLAPRRMDLDTGRLKSATRNALILCPVQLRLLWVVERCRL